MSSKNITIITIFLVFTTLTAIPVFADSPVVAYLCELGVISYQQEKYDEALSEFNKALLLDPASKTAHEYIEKILSPINPSKDSQTSSKKILKAQPERVTNKAKETSAREDIINDTLYRLNKDRNTTGENINKAAADAAKEGEKEPVILSGEYRLALGITPDDMIWKDANADKIGIPREKNWRYLWGEKRHNTYDPKIYDRLNLDIQSQFDQPLNVFAEITVDPWTYIGKNKVGVTSIDGTDTIDIELKYWSADGRTINEVYRSNKGNIINLKPIKINDGRTTAITPSGLTDWNTNFNSIPTTEISRDYRPLRKLWLDYKEDDYVLKIFPISDEFEALTTDDPLRLSNNHMYWEESPWLDEYEPSRLFYPDSGLNPIKKGRWIRRLSFFTKDSSDDYPHRLTFLRGASFKANTDSFSLEAALATPMSLWDDYETVNSVEDAIRLKIPFENNLQIGLIGTSKLGMSNDALDAQNQVGALDLNYDFLSSYSAYGQIAASYTEITEAAGFNTVYDGVGAKLGVKYDAVKEKKGEDGFYYGEGFVAHMDSDFFPGLSNYRYTRNDDPTFSRHIYFSEIADLDKPLVSGDGIDRGRNSAGLKLKAKSFNEKLDTDIDYRNVHKASGKYVESVLRAEADYELHPRLSSKLLGYYQHLPKTHGNYDPLIYAKTMYSLTDYFSEEDIFPENSSIVDGKDPSVGAFGLGLKYGLVENIVSLEGIYERTNDPLDFPRGLLADTYVSSETKDGHLWDKVVPFLYDQGFFDLPPYNYYNIAKGKLIYTPQEKWEFILSGAYNENRYASGINDNINHAGIEADYKPTDKLTLWFKYIYSRLIDVYKQNQCRSSGFYEGHHNAFFGSEYQLNPDSSFTLLYGEFVGYDNPYEQSYWTLSALDTQHIFRLFYKRKF